LGTKRKGDTRTRRIKDKSCVREIGVERSSRLWRETGEDDMEVSFQMKKVKEGEKNEMKIGEGEGTMI
jgi:hypothetical protein